jgi:glycosyltransferase involved in cell wall biosynthesis
VSKKSYYPLKKAFFDFISAQILRSYDFNVLHTWLNQSLFTMHSARKKKAKIILECGSTHPEFRTELFHNEYKQIGLTSYKIDKKELKRALMEIDLADFILTPSNFAAKTFTDKNIPKNKVFVIPRGVNLARFKPEKKEQYPVRVVFAGHIGIRKGAHYLLEAWKSFKNEPSLELLLIGDIQEDFKPFVKEFSNIKNIKFLGFIKEPWNYFNTSHIFVFPTLEEGSAKVVYEAMASGMAVITTEHAGSIIENNKDGIIIPFKNSEKIRENIELLLNNRNLVDFLTLNAINKVNNYTWENYQENLINFYRKNIL